MSEIKQENTQPQEKIMIKGDLDKDEQPFISNLITKNRSDTSLSSTGSILSSTSNSTNKVAKAKKASKKKKKNLCFHGKCTNLASNFIGDCKFCNGHFCSKHRLMENHDCKGLNNCKKQMHDRNAEKLNKEQTHLPKIQI